MWGNGNNNGKPPSPFINNGVFSYNQSGGITAQTVNMVPPARKLDEQFKREFRAGVPAGTTIDLAHTSDHEAVAFTNEIREWLKAEGYVLRGDSAVLASFPPMEPGVIVSPVGDGAFRVAVGPKG